MAEDEKVHTHNDEHERPGTEGDKHHVKKTPPNVPGCICSVLKCLKCAAHERYFY
jgi:hypothetical protein